MYTVKFGPQGEHIPEEFQPAWYTESEGGKWLPFPPSQSVTRKSLEQARSANVHCQAASIVLGGVSAHSLLVPAPNVPLGWFLRWDLYNGWGMSLYLPELVPSLRLRPLPADHPYHEDLGGDLPSLAQFAKEGRDASYHYADDSGKEWQQGALARDRAIAIWQKNKHLTEKMLYLARDFLWSFSTFVESERGKE